MQKMRPLRKDYVQDPEKMFKDGKETKRSKAMGSTCSEELGLSFSETKVNSNKSTMGFVGLGGANIPIIPMKHRPNRPIF